MTRIETIRVKSGDDFAIINKDDFDADIHEMFDDDDTPSVVEVAPTLSADELSDVELRSAIEAVVGGTVPADVSRQAMADVFNRLSERPQSAVEIPADWADLHWKKQAAIAKEISGADATNAEAAAVIIEGEIQARRAVVSGE